MSKTKELAKNTAIFAVGTIGSKLTQFLLVPIYTIYLTSAEYSAGDLIVSTVFLLNPLLTIGIGNGIIRFVLEHSENRGPVLKLCIGIVLISTMLQLPFISLINELDVFCGYGFLVPILFFCYSLKHVLANYCKAIEKNMQYSLDGIFSAISLTFFSFLFLAGLHWGIFGYVFASILSLVGSIIYLVYICDVFFVLKKAKIDKKLSKDVIKYAFPLMPNELSWWVVQMSNRYILVAFCGAAVNGVFSMAYKLPGIFNLIVSIFIQAFGITAIKECNQEKRINNKIDGTYFGKVFEKYCSITFISVFVVILASRPLAVIFLQNDFFEAWKYVPFLLCAYAIGNLQSFYGSIYSGLKKTDIVFISTVLGAVTSTVLNFILVPYYGAFGASAAAISSYFVIYMVRYWGLKKNIEMPHYLLKNIISIIIILTTACLYVGEYFEFIIVGAIFIILLYRKSCEEMYSALLQLIKKNICKRQS